MILKLTSEFGKVVCCKVKLEYARSKNYIEYKNMKYT